MRVRRALLRRCALPTASVGSRSAEKSESSVPSELLPAVLCGRQERELPPTHTAATLTRVFLPADGPTKTPCQGRSAITPLTRTLPKTPEPITNDIQPTPLAQFPA